MENNPHRVRVVFRCAQAHEHELCVTVTRGVPPECRCSDDQGVGYGSGAGGGCSVPSDLAARVERELRDDLQQAKRRGYVLVTV